MVSMQEKKFLTKTYGCLAGGCASILEVSWQIHIRQSGKVIAKGGCVVNGAHVASHMAVAGFMFQARTRCQDFWKKLP